MARNGFSGGVRKAAAERRFRNPILVKHLRRDRKARTRKSTVRYFSYSCFVEPSVFGHSSAVDEGLETLCSNKRKIDGPVLVVARVVAVDDLPEVVEPLLRVLWKSE